MTDQDSEEAPPRFGDCAPTSLQAAYIVFLNRSFLGSGRIRGENAKIIEAMRPGPLDVRFRGAAFRVHAKGNITEKNILLNPSFDARELDFLIGATPADGVFFDVGANIGLYSLVIAAYMTKRGRVIALEPDSISRERFIVNKALSNADNVTIIPLAVGDIEGDVSFAHNSRDIGQSRVKDSGDIRVAMKPLASILADVGVTHIDCMKIDIEGYEDRAVMPFLRDASFSRWPRAVVIERNTGVWGVDCIKEMIGRGYKLVGETRANTLLKLCS